MGPNIDPPVSRATIAPVPLYDFLCSGCGHEFEQLVPAGTDRATCPDCGSAEASRRPSPVSPMPRVGLRGGDARRAEAKRRAIRERRREQRSSS
jgi:putative FmdB family regulatory protein